jgi:predicted ABC-type transport system involved in lysophospholipase L1 biosynthesis ATPase subunit
MSGGADVVIDNVTRTFTVSGDMAVEVLRGISLQVAAGEALAVTGPSGSGKTTLLQIIGAMDRQDSGEVRVNGRELGGLGEVARTLFRNREVGFVFQAHHLLPQLTALENVLVPAWNGRADDAAVARAQRLLERVGLGTRMEHFPGQMSGGERQRVALARALIMEPCLLLADEPTGALDHQNATALIDLLVELNRESGTTLIVVTHAEECASRMGRRVTLIDGKLKA